MNSLIKRHEDGTIELTVTVPLSLVEKTRDSIIDEHVKVAELPGFRKGMASRDLVEKSLSPEHIREDILKKLLPQSYIEAVEEHKLNPILNPKINVLKLGDKEDWVFTALTAETPEIKLLDYKDAVKKITAKGKIIVPGKEPKAVSFEEIAQELLANSTVKIPQIIIDQEVDRLLAQTLDEVKKLGLTLDQYLASTGKNTDVLRKEYTIKAENDVKLEFVLQKIAETENIIVEEKEIDEAIAQAQSEQERQNLKSNRHLLSNVIKQQKTLDFLRNL